MKQYRIEEFLSTSGKKIWLPQYYGYGLFGRKWRYFKYCTHPDLPASTESFKNKEDAETFIGTKVAEDRIRALPETERSKYHTIDTQDAK